MRGLTEKRLMMARLMASRFQDNGIAAMIREGLLEPGEELALGIFLALDFVGQGCPGMEEDARVAGVMPPMRAPAPLGRVV